MTRTTYKHCRSSPLLGLSTQPALANEFFQQPSIMATEFALKAACNKSVQITVSAQRFGDNDGHVCLPVTVANSSSPSEKGFKLCLKVLARSRFAVLWSDLNCSVSIVGRGPARPKDSISLQPTIYTHELKGPRMFAFECLSWSRNLLKTIPRAR